MDICGINLDFRGIGGKQNPSYEAIKRLNARRSILCISQSLEREN